MVVSSLLPLLIAYLFYFCYCCYESFWCRGEDLFLSYSSRPPDCCFLTTGFLLDKVFGFEGDPAVDLWCWLVLLLPTFCFELRLSTRPVELDIICLFTLLVTESLLN